MKENKLDKTIKDLQVAKESLIKAASVIEDYFKPIAMAINVAFGKLSIGLNIQYHKELDYIKTEIDYFISIYNIRPNAILVNTEYINYLELLMISENDCYLVDKLTIFFSSVGLRKIICDDKNIDKFKCIFMDLSKDNKENN